MKILKSTAALAGVICLSGSVFAQTVTYNFDDAVNPFSNGTISTNYSVSGSSSLFFDLNQIGAMDLAAEYVGQHVQVSFQMLDLGKWATPGTNEVNNRKEGPRLGVVTAADDGAGTLAFSIYNGRNFAPSNANYGINSGTRINDGTWFGIVSWPNVTRIALSDTPDDGSIANPPVWMMVTYDVAADGTATMTSSAYPDDPFSRNLGDAITRILIHGGRNTELAGVYVDDLTISVVPEPGTYALALGALGLLVVLIRRRR